MKALEEIGEGEVARLPNGDTLFILSSHPGNPIIKPRDLGLTWSEGGVERVGAVFNGGAAEFEGGVVLTPRIHRNYRRLRVYDERLGLERWVMENYISEVWPLWSRDGVSFSRINQVSIKGDGSTHRDFTYGVEDIRIIRWSGFYLLVGCGKIRPPFKGGDSDRIAVYTTRDFIKIRYHGIVREFDSRNSFPFPEEVDGRLYMLLRFHPNIHLDVLEGGVAQILSPGDYSENWRRMYERRGETLLIRAGELPHEAEKVGAGPPPIKTREGWLLIYHGVGKVGREVMKLYGYDRVLERSYVVSAAILDPDDPKRIIARTRYPIYVPSHPWELEGNENYPVDIPFVIFPTGAITKEDKLLIYAGAGDKYMVLLGCRLENLLNYILSESKK